MVDAIGTDMAWDVINRAVLKTVVVLTRAFKEVNHATLRMDSGGWVSVDVAMEFIPNHVLDRFHGCVPEFLLYLVCCRGQTFGAFHAAMPLLEVIEVQGRKNIRPVQRAEQPCVARHQDSRDFSVNNLGHVWFFRLADPLHRPDLI